MDKVVSEPRISVRKPSRVPALRLWGQMNTFFMLTLQETAPQMRSATSELQRKCRLLKGFDRKVSNSYT